MDTLAEAFSILVVGMITVFFILYMIVVIGDVIIRLSNRYLPEVVHAPKRKSNTSDSTHAAIEAAISLVTQGTGKATNITKQ